MVMENHSEQTEAPREPAAPSGGSTGRGFPRRLVRLPATLRAWYGSLSWPGKCVAGATAIISVVVAIMSAIQTIDGFVTDYAPGKFGRIREWSSQPPPVLFASNTGRLGAGYRLDDQLAIESITYRLDSCSVVLDQPRTVMLDSLPVVYDGEDEHKWKIRTAWLNARADLQGPALLRVPQKIRVNVRGSDRGDHDTLHVFTDEDYAFPVEPARGASTATLELTVGAEGFAGFLDQSSPGRPRLPANPLENMTDLEHGPVAVLVVTATNRAAPSSRRAYRRSAPVVLLRAGVRTPEDVWTFHGSVHLAFVSDTLPPLVVFQSVNTCSRPQRNGVYASTIDGSEIFKLSPAGPYQSTLARVEPGPPAHIYFRSQLSTGAQRVCHEVVLRYSHPRTTRRVDEARCRGMPP
jgi:hypothetical protein